MRDHCGKLAAYNRWANAWLYAAALAVTDKAYRRRVGVFFFGSLHGTLNHLLLTDRLWLKRLTGEGEHPNTLDKILYDDRAELARARIAEDQRLIAVIDGYDEAAFAEPVVYATISGARQEQPLSDILQHLFNHHAHHRGQAHACCSIVGAQAPLLDLLAFQRGLPAPDLASMI